MTDMEIKWLGHSCFRIKGKYNTIITDPYSQDFGYSLGKPSADIITVSHQHPGHNYTTGIAGNPKIVDGPGEYEFLSKGNLDAVIIIGVATYHDNPKGEDRG